MLSRVASLATRSLSRHVRTFATGGQQIAALSQSLPHLDVVQYEHKNRVWSLQHVDYYSEALAIGIVENGLQTGDVVLSWMPDHFAEQVGSTVASWIAGFFGMMILSNSTHTLTLIAPDGSSIRLLESWTRSVHSGRFHCQDRQGRTSPRQGPRTYPGERLDYARSPR